MSVPNGIYYLILSFIYSVLIYGVAYADSHFDPYCKDLFDNPIEIPASIDVSSGLMAFCTPGEDTNGIALPVDGTYTMICWITIDEHELLAVDGVGPLRYITFVVPEQIMETAPPSKLVNYQCAVKPNEDRGPARFADPYPAEFPPMGVPGRPTIVIPEPTP